MKRVRTLKEARARIVELEDDLKNYVSIVDSLQEIVRIKDRLLTAYRTRGIRIPRKRK